MTFRPLYRCRLCGAEYLDPRELDYDPDGLIARLVGLDDYQGYPLGGHRISIVESHICKDGNIGIAELKGFVKNT